MKHYEIVLMIHPDQSEQLDAMLGKYRGIIEEKGGKNPQIRRLGSSSTSLSYRETSQSALCTFQC